MNNEKTAREPHALDSVAISGDRKPWKRRLEQWQGVMEYEERLSWLHTNSVRDGNCPEWPAFYISLADRHGDENHFLSLPEHKQTIWTRTTIMSFAEIKSALSKKAFAILCEHFFAAFLQEEGQKPCPYYPPLSEPSVF